MTTAMILSKRITAYLAGGGLFNPEQANHDAVRDLLIDCRACFEASAPAASESVAQEPDCWAILTPNGSRLVSPQEAQGCKTAYPLYTAPQPPVASSDGQDRHEAALQKVFDWAQAYPLDVFPEPDWKRAAQVLKDAGMTLDSISASNMRHVITKVADIVRAALKGEHHGKTI